MVAGGIDCLLLRRMEVVMVWWQVAIKKVLKQTIHSCLRHFAWDGGDINSNAANAAAPPLVCIMLQH
jgi:hypothetical protein